METYQISQSPTGPWLEPTITDDPQRALTRAKAAYGWDVIWLAKMRPLTAEDVMPPPEMFWADMFERLATQYGNYVVDAMELVSKIMPFDQLERALQDSMDMCDVEIMVPEIIHGYRQDQNVRPNDFKPKEESGVKVDPAYRQEKFDKKMKQLSLKDMIDV